VRGYNSKKSVGILLVLLLAGALIGSLLGDALGGIIPFLQESKSLGFPATTIDLVVLTFTIGFTMKLNAASILGFILAYFAYRRI
jgi:ABC-type antimicrobial peptide transport system permease subunit